MCHPDLWAAWFGWNLTPRIFGADATAWVALWLKEWAPTARSRRESAGLSGLGPPPSSISMVTCLPHAASSCPFAVLFVVSLAGVFGLRQCWSLKGAWPPVEWGRPSPEARAFCGDGGYSLGRAPAGPPPQAVGARRVGAPAELRKGLAALSRPALRARGFMPALPRLPFKEFVLFSY